LRAGRELLVAVAHLLEQTHAAGVDLELRCDGLLLLARRVLDEGRDGAASRTVVEARQVAYLDRRA
jgi:hypothetical protein